MAIIDGGTSWQINAKLEAKTASYITVSSNKGFLEDFLSRWDYKLCEAIFRSQINIAYANGATQKTEIVALQPNYVIAYVESIFIMHDDAW